MSDIEHGIARLGDSRDPGPGTWGGLLLGDVLRDRLVRLGAVVHAWLPEMTGHEFDRFVEYLNVVGTVEGGLGDLLAKLAVASDFERALGERPGFGAVTPKTAPRGVLQVISDWTEAQARVQALELECYQTNALTCTDVVDRMRRLLEQKS